MRLNSSWGEENRPLNTDSGVERVERLLRGAADFEPPIQPVNDFVRVALRRRDQRRARRLRSYVLTFSSGVAAMLLVGLALSRFNLLQPTLSTFEEAPVQNPVPPGPAVTDNHNSNPPVTTDARGSSRAETHEETAVSPTGPVRRNRPRSEEPDSDVRRSIISDASLRTGGRSHAERREPPIPKVRWQNEVVQRYDRGVIEPAYVVEERDHNGDTIYKPVMMPVTTETGARPVLVDGMPDTSIQLTSLSEETSQK